MSIIIEEQYIKIAPANPWGLKYTPLYHQYRTAMALKDKDMVINTYSTGAGKTVAALLHLFGAGQKNVLFIAPTNELIEQHYKDINEFVSDYSLNYNVIKITGPILREIEEEANKRNGKKLVEIMTNPATFNELNLRQDAKNYIMVTNPDIFYLSLYCHYSEIDERNLFYYFASKFNYIIVDEFHYYNAKQLANFLFFFAMSKEFGYFDGTRKVCILTATPDEHISKYLNSLGINCEIISPENEPKESENFQKLRSLSKIILHPIKKSRNKGEDFSFLIEDITSDIKMLINNGKDGVIISDSLIQINKAYSMLKKEGLQSNMIRITGAVTKEERMEYYKYPLVLATPTVDIGFNFTKANKERQNIDFLLFEAIYPDQFMQRLGRAGRVMGKKVQDCESIVYAVVDKNMYNALMKHDGEVLDRAKISRIAEENMPHNNKLYSYIRSYSILEAMYPLYRFSKQLEDEYIDRIRRLFENLKTLFDSDSDISFDSIMFKMKLYDALRLCRDNDYKEFSDIVIRDYVYNKYLKEKKIDEFEKNEKNDVKLIKNNVYINKFLKNYVIEHVEEQLSKYDSIFRFRGDNISIKACIYDPKGIMNKYSQIIYYDLFHILKNYDYKIYRTRYELIRDSEVRDIEYSDVYLKILNIKNDKLTVGFEIRFDGDKETFEKYYKDKVVAFKGLVIKLRKNKTDINLEQVITDYIKNNYIVLYLCNETKLYYYKNLFEINNMTFYDLRVVFNEGSEEYKTVIGSDSYLLNSVVLQNKGD